MELGKKQTLYIVKNVKFGVYLAEENDPDAAEKVLQNNVDPDAERQSINSFVKEVISK